MSALLLAGAMLALASPALEAEAEALRAQAGLPAVALARISCGRVETAMSGVPRLDRPDAPWPASSRFAIGSNAKAMLATAAMRMAGRGEIAMDAPLGTLWPDAAGNGAAAAITLRQLLAHRSGLPPFSSGRELDRVPALGGGGDHAGESATVATARWFLAQPMAGAPGEALLYSNAGYVVAGALLERAAGMPLGDVLAREVFAPLRLDAVMGAPRDHEPLGPHGHVEEGEGLVPYLDAAPALPPFLEAAGNVSLSPADYARFVEAQLCALEGRGNALLAPGAAAQMHRPVAEEASLGWGRVELGGQLLSFHIGGTGTFTAYAAIAPGADRAVIALTNAGGDRAGALQGWLVAQFPAGDDKVEEAP
ncbi:serine hydrolase domain-containing protein [Sphingomicrobium aestuariivivum]|uniref:serine hydrolase domain-containing protein n=1 Tax=Sphingomicrobium aestuariivivum TaxID=1582356 RepID=UPI001FD6D3DF|nr:serine hydrolase domain-containing protein [Sphingomicrobium aestuariivivum]MCJ8190682.1 beta-lactamase family protein [Sphingomicrobium aestuariivivum]